ncbi:MAG: GTPase HflX [Anaerolineales bacterium]|nr:GTPase HflX [Anaerolineales bacterium]
MAKKYSEPTHAIQHERVFLVGVQLQSQASLLTVEDSLSELALLSDTAGLEVVGTTTQRLDRPFPKTFIGPGKIEEVQALIRELDAQMVIFDDELSPRHQRELEEIFGDKVRVLDRTALILDIFAQHAQTREGILQVELAQYEYRLPRLTRAWTHLARQAGGKGSLSGVGLRGPGETQLEVDRRDISRRIDHLKAELEKVRAHRERHRNQRRKSELPVVAVVGYTNAGKSTLLNRLAGADVYVANQLFATLDPTTRRVELPGGHLALFTDTVGFIQKLPTGLVAAFRATLEEIAEADMLLHVLDITHPNVHAQAEAVLQTLEELNADHIPILTVLNKIDQLPDPEGARTSVAGNSDAVAISALKGEGHTDLLDAINRKLYESFEQVSVRLSYQEGGLQALFRQQGQVDRVEHDRNDVIMYGRIPGRLLARFQPFIQMESHVGSI